VEHPGDVPDQAHSIAIRARHHGNNASRNPVSHLLGAAIACSLVLVSAPGSAQELEPGAYWPLPTGLNIVTVVNSLNWGDMAFDPAAPIEDGSAMIDITALAFTRAFDLVGRSANVGVVLPVVGGHLEGRYLGLPAEAGRFGLGDPRLRLAMNLYGAPAMAPPQFASYRQQTIVGVSITAALPLGQYDPTKLINIGTNRWSFKPEIGISRTCGHWVIEAMAGGWLFTDNDTFFGARTRAQKPIAEVQVHVTYRFKRTVWLAADANYYRGGRTTVGGRRNVDFQRNSRIGATFSCALRRGHAIRLALSQGAYTTIGADFTSVAVGYNYAWVR
jgi:hypothetical protein